MPQGKKKEKISMDKLAQNFEKFMQGKKTKNITKKQFENNLKKAAKSKQSGSK